ncbi:hypothetical protein MtrunA17_Chr4g0058271 [Medicago truncatula]|uniref:Uncharacterized protein n=1 Tax=Medicago truncatula TaxID=3880 RepID=A0A396IF59_MEDTR|nr:hypothetical protein MtrunA17_Chr4g0058271 [Medicago truncatula]
MNVMDVDALRSLAHGILAGRDISESTPIYDVVRYIYREDR